MVIETVTESNSQKNNSNQYYKQLKSTYDNLFCPIDEKRLTYWAKPVTNAKELVKFATNNDESDKYIEIYTSINDDEVGTIRTIFLDFDLSNESMLEWELNNTLQDVKDSEISSIIDKYHETENINDLSNDEQKKLLDYLINYETEKLAGMSEEETRRYYYNKIAKGFLKEPFEEAIIVANYFIEQGIMVTLNWSGSKGLHIRIPLNQLIFNETKINNDPKLFILSLAEAIETTVLGKSIRSSTIDYVVLNRNKGLQRLPCSKHSKSKLYSNFISIGEDYNTAIRHLLLENPSYLPKIVDKKENTDKFLASSIVKEAIATATENKADDNYSDEYANPHYNFSSDHKELKEMIKNVYINGHRNEIGYRIVHLFRRSGFEQKTVENIFKEFHDSQSSDYADTIEASIKHAYSIDISRLGGLKHLIKGIEELPNYESKQVTIDYFKNNFGYYDKPTETEVEPFRFKDRDVTVTVYENHDDKWVVFSKIYENIDLELNFNTLQGNFIKDNNRSIITFEFKYSKQLFKVADKEFKVIKEFMSDEGVELPKMFVQMLKQYFKNKSSFISESKKLTEEQELMKLFSNTHINVRTARRKLGHYLKEHGMILRQDINTPYLLDKNVNGYNMVTTDEIVMELDNSVFNNKDLVHSKDVEDAIGFIAERKKPEYNIVKFNNCLYDMENFRVITANEEPIFTLTEVAHNYNPQAKGEKVQNFLKTSLSKEEFTSEETQNKIDAFLEMIGYLLTSGNKLNAFFILAGVGGAGKGVASDLIINIFGTDKVGGLQLQELTPDNRFATAHLENKQVNIVSDSSSKPISDTGLLKAITGYDDIPVEPKGKDKYMIPRNEVPDMILVCNNIPDFKDGIEEAIVQRIVMFEFFNKFRGTDKANPNLLNEILADPEEMEWLIFNGIKAYEKMTKNNKDFKARIDGKKAGELLGKHTDPISHVLPKLVKYSKEESNEESIIAKELNELVKFVAEDDGMAINNLDTNGLIKPRFLVSEIRKTFELDDNWTSQSKYFPKSRKSKIIYPYLYKTSDYDSWLEKMNKQKEKNN